MGVCNSTPKLNESGTKQLEELKEILATIPLLSVVPDSKLDEFASLFRTKRIPDGEWYVKEGELSKCFFVVKSGKLQLVKRIHGNDCPIKHLLAQDYGGESFLKSILTESGTPPLRTAGCLAQSPCEIWEINDESFSHFIAHLSTNTKEYMLRAVAQRQHVITRNDERELNTEPSRTSTAEDEMLEIVEALEEKSETILSLLSNKDKNFLHAVAKQMELVRFDAGTRIIKYGETGDTMYVIREGTCKVYSAGHELKTILGPKSCFGELALMYNSPRNATIDANEGGYVECWKIQGATFRNVLSKYVQKKFGIYAAALKRMPILETLTSLEIEQLAGLYIVSPYESSLYYFTPANINEVDFKEGFCIITFGKTGECCYFIEDGCCVVEIPDEEGKMKSVKKLTAGDSFGEMALMNNEPRSATVRVIGGNCRCFVIQKSTFDTIFGPLSELLKKRSEVYLEKAPSGPHKDSTEFAAFDSEILDKTLKFQELAVISLVGKGSYGDVYLVQHKVTKKTYALKEVSKYLVESNKNFRHILNERNLMARMHSPHIANLIAVFQTKTKLYFVQEPCLGGELYQLLLKQKSMSEKNAKFYIGSIILALEYLHKRKVCFRDLKTENVLLDSHGNLKLVDFGFAKIMEKPSQTLCGTPIYLAPEMIMGHAHSFGVDFWCLGILSYEILVGRPPFIGHAPMDTYRKILKKQPHFPSGLSAGCVDFLTSLLRKRQHKRLGVANGGFSSIFNHPFFKGFDWDALREQRMEAPFVPNVSEVTDTSNFSTRQFYRDEGGPSKVKLDVEKWKAFTD